MDEEKAAAYYEDILRRGGGAAKLKQGLGYDAPPPPSSSAEAPAKPSLLSFVKGDNHSDSLAKLQKANRLAAVRDKLKRGPGYPNDVVRNPDHYDVNKLPYYARSPERDHTTKRERNYEGWRSYDDFCGQTVSKRERTFNGHQKRHEGHILKASTHKCIPAVSNSPCGAESGSRDQSYSQSSLDSDQRRYHHRHSSNTRSVSYCRKSSSRSRSPERIIHLGLASVKECKRERRRSSPREPYLVSGKHQTGTGRGTCKSDSWYGDREMRNNSGALGRRSLKKRSAFDYSKLIPGFDYMTQAEKVKAKMKYQLSVTVSKDTAKGIGNEWERFTFDKSAPLDDDAKLDYFGDGLGSSDDAHFLQNSGSTFLSTCSQAKREAQIQAAHDTAIFGPSVGMSNEKMGSHSCLMEATTMDSDPIVQIDKATTVKDLLSEQVLNLQQSSWRERALKLKEQGSGTL